MIDNFNEVFYEKTGYHFNAYFKKIKPKLIYFFKFNFNKTDLEANDLCSETFEKVLSEIHQFHKVYALNVNMFFLPTTDKSFYEKELLYEQCDIYLIEMLSGKKITDLNKNLQQYTYNNTKNEKLYNIIDPCIHLNRYVKRNDTIFSNNIDSILFKCTDNIIIDEVIVTDNGFYIIEILDNYNVIFDTWLFKVAKNFCMIHTRNNSMLDYIDDEDNRKIDSKFNYSIDDTPKEHSQYLYDSIDKIREPDKSMLMMRLTNESSYEEIARKFDTFIDCIDDKYINKDIRFDYEGIDLRTFTKFLFEKEICGKLYDIIDGNIHIVFSSDRRKKSQKELNYLYKKIDWYSNNNEDVFIFNLEKVSNIHLLYILQNVKNKIHNSKKELLQYIKEYI